MNGLFPIRYRVLPRWFVPDRYLNGKLSAAAGARREVDRSTVFLNDAVADGQSQTCALSGLFRGEEWVEDPVADIRTDAAARILNLHHDVALIA